MRTKRSTKKPDGAVTPHARRSTEPPVIVSEHGQTTEWARKQAAENIRDFPEVRARVERMLTKKLGSRARAIARMRHDYPEAYAGGN